VLIGQVVAPVPAISLQEGNQLKLFALDGDEFREVAQQALPPGTHGILMADNGAQYYFFLGQGVLWRGVVGAGPEAIIPFGR
jgi:hypothetical protein